MVNLLCSFTNLFAHSLTKENPLQLTSKFNMKSQRRLSLFFSASSGDSGFGPGLARIFISPSDPGVPRRCLKIGVALISIAALFSNSSLGEYKLNMSGKRKGHPVCTAHNTQSWHFKQISKVLNVFGLLSIKIYRNNNNFSVTIL